VRVLTAIFSLAVLLGAAPGALATKSGALSAGAGDAGFAPISAPQGSAGAGASASPCVDGKYNFLAGGASWKHSLSWSFRSSSVPPGLSSSGVLAALKQSFSNITGEHNDCGRGDTVNATSTYLGTTTRRPNVSASGGCGTPDGHNVIGFAPLNGFYAGYTCIWWQGNEIVEADTRLDSDTKWALSTSPCSGAVVLEALMTHEAGHAFGLAHVSESKHGRLTMSVYIDGLCEDQEATLGKGDMKGLEALY
jgi:Matrixin